MIKSFKSLLFFLVLLPIFSQFEQPFGIFYYPYFYGGCLLILAVYILQKTYEFKIKDLLPSLLISSVFMIGLVLRPDSNAFKLLLTTVLATFLSTALVILYRHDKKIFLSVLEFILKLNAILIVLQALAFYISGSYIDIHNIVFPWSQGKGAEISSFGTPRFTGLQLEPGTYAAFEALLILTSLSIRKHIRYWHILCVFSFCLTFSTEAMLYLFLCLITCIYMHESKFTHKIFLTVILISILGFLSFHIGLYEYFDNRFITRDSTDMSFDERWMSVNYWINTTYTTKILGYGYGIDGCVECTTSQGVGVLFNLVTQGGIISVLILFVGLASLVRVSNFTFPSIMLFVVLLICRLPIYWAAVYLLLFLLLYELSEIETAK